ncbi:hypothetical protein BVRB_5g115000 [Beta vulgaris subsp. vulgaris]|uniref:uncharacterized WD repeat-containing protein C25H1.08c isoform X2 n=1 Tax=Beta vulgaris subsp. vulgaris TaxID=3555 RepID=UPI00065C46CC|nr:uncharacterized WD repeat-containing protein C25H1.08c isoform X2 [Beta vulgaris subsp. vulgaris]KMT10369.1 hypothetical protein BVRB_5g115000 [Beta vulgaris subsp. vulgaris]
MAKSKSSSDTEGAISDDDGHEEVFLDESDIIDEILLDDEDLPDVDDDEYDGEEVVSEDMSLSEPDDAIHVFTHHKKSLYAVACSPKDAALVASGGGDNLACLWRIGCEKRIDELVGHEESISSLAFSTDGQLLASGGLDGCVKIWNISGNLKCTLEGHDKDTEFEWVRWHSSAHLVLAGCTDATVWLWNADRDACLNVLCGHSQSVTCGDFTPDGKSICTGSLDATLRIWNPRSGQSTVAKGYMHASALSCLAYTSDSTLALTGAENGFVSVVNIAKGKVTSSVSSHSSSVQCIGISSSMPWVATGGADEKLVIWDLQHSACRSVYEYQDDVSCLKWLGESRYVASACGDGQIIIWDTRSEDHVRTFKGHSERIHELAVSADNNFLVSASEDGTARVFDISDFR